MNSVDILVPDLPESVANATIAIWHKKLGDRVLRDEVLLEIETNKVILEIPASTDGILYEVLEYEGNNVIPRQILGRLRENNGINKNSISKCKNQSNDETGLPIHGFMTESTSVSRRITCEDIDNYITKESSDTKIEAKVEVEESSIQFKSGSRSEKRVPMTHLRKRIAERLLETKNSTAMLTTFNEVNMKPIVDLRKKYSEIFEKRHGIRLGFMSFYVKAVIETLKRYPKVNAFIDGDDVIYHNYFDISIAVSTPRGLVTPVLRDVENLSMADIEKRIKDLVLKGCDGKLTINDLTGGNFTITNGGIFGSLMSTPIINPPQSAILGMHAIKDRPMAVDGRIEILPMMYLALSYDHRLIDGQDSISFLVAIKDLLEDPTRLLLNV